ncbi:MAG: metallophosphoesterase [Bacteroidaceae bacterium]|nr:metallophosphoesterase [Bacteroidaceae bacterium]
MFQLILSVTLLLLCVANVYFYHRLVQWLPPLHWSLRVVIALLLVALSSSFIAAMMMRHANVQEWLVKSLYNVGSVWLVFMLYVVLFLLLADALRLLFPTFRHGFPVAVIATSVLLAYGYWNRCHPRVVDVDIPLKGWTGDTPLTVVGISDVHLGDGTGRNRLSGYVDLINDLKPHVILIAGDLIDNSLYPLRSQQMKDDLNRLYAPHGIYMVPGNHEYIAKIWNVERYLKQTPICLLRDSVVTLPQGITLVGRDDRHNNRRLSLENLMFPAGGENPVIVMDHQPTEIALADSLGAQMVFCGHTHRGQLWPLTWLTDALFEQSHGYRRWQNAHAYVSQGLSLWGPPFRIESHSEVVVFHLHAAP